MDALMKQSREVQGILAGLVLFIIFSFFDWQQVSIAGYTAGKSLWNGFGIIVALVAIAFLAWEITRLLNVQIGTGSVTPGQISAGLALVLLILTVIVFLDWSDFRHWPQWVGLILAIGIAGAEFVRAKAEGVTMPELPKSTGGSGGGSSTAAATPPPASSTPPPAAPSTPPPAPADDTAPPPDSTGG